MAASEARGDAASAASVIKGQDGLAARLGAVDWPDLCREVDSCGFATFPPLLMPEEAAAVCSMYQDDARFRSTVVMARHGFGSGEYRYFAYPLPGLIAELREALYVRLLPLANAWRLAAGQEPLPATHRDYLELCHAAGQRRPTPLLLHYRKGDYNCLHQDLYGDLSFPLQAVFLLSAKGSFEGGELILTEQRPRMQSRAHLVPLECYGGAIFAVAKRPIHGGRGVYHVSMRHGVSTIRRGRRHTLGIIFHDAS